MKNLVGSKCPCGKKFKNLKWFTVHVRRYHPLLLKCNYCGINFNRIEQYVLHRCEIIEGKLFVEPIIQTQCLKCQELVDMGEPFDKHMKSHTTDPAVVYHCFKCELTFENEQQRKLHFNKHHGFTLCRVCSKLLRVDYICKHEAYHDGLGHPCHICKKSFSQKALLRKHIQNSHDPLANEMVNCSVCSESIKIRYLKKHMSYHLHTEICKKCNKCYQNHDNKEPQKHIPAENPDFTASKCDNCEMSFLSDTMFQEHSKKESCKTNLKETIGSVNNINNERLDISQE